jgi:hypothetical protein
LDSTIEFRIKPPGTISHLKVDVIIPLVVLIEEHMLSVFDNRILNKILLTKKIKSVTYSLKGATSFN